MVYSFVFLGERNRKKILEQLTSKITLSSSSYQVLFLTNKKQKNEGLATSFPYTNFRTIVFKESASSSQMFETIVHNESLGTVVLFKETAKEINFADINRMIEKNQNGSKIVVSKQIKQENFFSKIWDPIKSFFTKIFIGLKLYPGEADIILLDSVLCETLSELDGKSNLLTTVNGWAGAEPKVVSIPKQEKPKNKFNIRKFINPIIFLSVFLCLITGNIVLSALNINLPFIAIFAYIILDIAIFGIFLYSLTRSVFNNKFGQISYTLQTDVIEIIDNYED